MHLLYKNKLLMHILYLNYKLYCINVLYIICIVFFWFKVFIFLSLNVQGVFDSLCCKFCPKRFIRKKSSEEGIFQVCKFTRINISQIMNDLVCSNSQRNKTVVYANVSHMFTLINNGISTSFCFDSCVHSWYNYVYIYSYAEDPCIKHL